MSGWGAFESRLCNKPKEQPEAKNAAMNKNFEKDFIFLLLNAKNTRQTSSVKNYGHSPLMYGTRAVGLLYLRKFVTISTLGAFELIAHETHKIREKSF